MIQKSTGASSATRPGWRFELFAGGRETRVGCLDRLFSFKKGDGGLIELGIHHTIDFSHSPKTRCINCDSVTRHYDAFSIERIEMPKRILRIQTVDIEVRVDLNFQTAIISIKNVFFWSTLPVKAKIGCFEDIVIKRLSGFGAFDSC